MSKIVNSVHPYNIRGIKYPSDFIIVLKQITNIIKSEGFKYKNNSNTIPIRWSISKECWVLDNKTKKSRDLEGVSLSDIDHCDFGCEYKLLIKKILLELNENKSLNDFLSQYKLKKNENKTLIFEGSYTLCNDINLEFDIFFIGLFKHEKNNETFIIDDSFYFIKEFTKNSALFINSYFILNNIQINFDDFISSIKEKKLDLSIDDNKRCMSVKEFLDNNLPIKNRTLTINSKKYKTNDTAFYYKIREGINLNRVDINSIISYPMIIYITELYGDYIKSTIKKEKEITTILVREKRKNLLYKLHGSFYYNRHIEKTIELNKKEEFKKELKTPLPFPGVF